jgi:hypothetical protein
LSGRQPRTIILLSSNTPGKECQENVASTKVCGYEKVGVNKLHDNYGTKYTYTLVVVEQTKESMNIKSPYKGGWMNKIKIPKVVQPLNHP